LIAGRAALDGPVVRRGAEQYIPVCWRHWDEAIAAATDRDHLRAVI
jgi:hypothetical protein